MGRSLGYFDSDELDRPELNKCPDCECYFASEECPLCGKICPENFRAGNRAPVKKPKKKKFKKSKSTLPQTFKTSKSLAPYFQPISS